jgi:thymidylate synthase (FAD)
MKDEFYVPAPSDLAAQSEDNKQGRMDEPLNPERAGKVIELLKNGQRIAYTDYSGLVGSGLAREIARINLPLSLYTEWYWQIDLHNLFRFLKLRLDSHAQKEIRLYAKVMLEIARAVAPAAVGSFERNLLDAVSFSGPEMAEIRRRLAMSAGVGGAGAAGGGTGAAGDQARPAAGQAKLSPGTALKGKELERFEEKLRSGKQL